MLGLAADRPVGDGLLFGGDFDYARVGLALVGFGMGFHLSAGTVNQAALARGRAAPGGRGVAGLRGAVPRLAVRAPLDDQLLAVEIGYCATTAVLALRCG